MSITNEGFRGMGLKEGLRYDFSLIIPPTKARCNCSCRTDDSTGKILGNNIVTPTEYR